MDGCKIDLTKLNYFLNMQSIVEIYFHIFAEEI